MELSEIKKKQVVDVNSGQILGNVIDINVKMPEGQINSILVSLTNQTGIFKRNRLISNGIIEIFWSNILTIGEDVILINGYFK